MALEVVVNKPGLYRILLEPTAEGVYVNIFDSPTAPGPSKDYLQNDMEMAIHACMVDYGIPPSAWKEVPDENWH